ncbi:hypothetical protein RSP795_07185 [Ralstonia solanacearum]|uniref:hypothetical protein n=1 Tax=Ralstonia solanacearum TaxID=305 RepID=UPI0007D86BF5|nr:hypothetical protein [Ralstonia solanacearum]OAI63544.1 hypothetical protein RSP795_07185 [Ralstonia solanacearum]
MATYLERALFVVGPRNVGKSTTLRWVFEDPRMGRGGEVPTDNKIRRHYQLSGGRRFCLRLTSPHEVGETLDEFLALARRWMASGGRWNFACPLQPDRYKNMPDAVDTIHAFLDEFHPERARVVFLWPNHKDSDPRTSKLLPEYLDLHAQLNPIIGIETVMIDTRQMGVNGTVLSDFFDFT